MADDPFERPLFPEPADWQAAASPAVAPTPRPAPAPAPPPAAPAAARKSVREFLGGRGIGLLLVVLGVFYIKLTVLLLADPKDLEARLFAMQAGSPPAQAVAWLMQPDPVTGSALSVVADLREATAQAGGLAAAALFVPGPTSSVDCVGSGRGVGVRTGAQGTGGHAFRSVGCDR
jgi:hypothetical protein